MSDSVLLWGGFNAVVVVLLALDLGILTRKDREISFKESLIWSGVWTALALVFNLVLWAVWPEHGIGEGLKPGDAAMQFFTGYLIERALSIDNLFVFIIIFSFFQVPKRLQYQVLFWGIIGALILRAIFIFAGAAIIERFEWTLYLFGAFLVFTGYKLAVQKETKFNPDKNPGLRLMRRVMPVAGEYHGKKYFIKKQHKLTATPLAAVLIVVAFTDLIFALDSIPAIFAVTHNTFIVYTSNIFAVLGLRALYFAVAELVHLFHFLNYGLCVVLIFIGLKMLLAKWVHMNVGLSLIIVFAVLTISVVASVIWPEQKGETKGNAD